MLYVIGARPVKALYSHTARSIIFLHKIKNFEDMKESKNMSTGKSRKLWDGSKVDE